MIDTFFGFKDRMNRVFDSQGKARAVTVVKAPPLQVVRFWDNRLLLGIGQAKRVRPSLKGLTGGLPYPPLFLREVAVAKEDPALGVGQSIAPSEILPAGSWVKVSGLSKGKDFAGAVKRWSFAGGPKTHGQSDRHRAPGSSGSTTTPGRVLKGKRRAGRMGGRKVTQSGLSVFKVEADELWLLGGVPGKRGALLQIKRVD